tara:strand:- start:12440 stop:12892 length:453 start_codon:yes stop_codon:yes gene_type:complete
MSSTITPATLTVTHTESVTLNGVDRGVTNTLTIASINEVDHRIVTVDTSAARTLLTLGATVGAGAFLKANIKYIRITNKDNTNYITLGMLDTSGDTAYVKLEAGQTFCMYNDDLEAFTNGAAWSAFSEIDTFNAQANTADVDVEVFVAST